MVAAMVLTVLLPDELSKGPTWLLLLIEGALLVALIVSDQARLTRRASHIRIHSNALVSVLVSYTLVVTWELIDDLIHGGKETNSASALLSASSVSGSRTSSPSRSSTGNSMAVAPPPGRTRGHSDDSTLPSRRT